MPRNIYYLDRQVVPGGALIYQSSHDLFVFKSGYAFNLDFQEPVVFTLDEELRNGPLPTFFSSPGFVAKAQISKDLLQLGIDNLQSYAAVIEDPIDGRKIEDYVFLNVIGVASCTNLSESTFEDLGGGMRIINKLVLDASRVPETDMFLLAEDTDKMLVSQKVADYFKAAGFPDVYLEKIQLA